MTPLLIVSGTLVFIILVLIILLFVVYTRGEAAKKDLLNRLMSRDFTDFASNVQRVDPGINKIRLKSSRANSKISVESEPETELDEFPVI